MSCALLTCLLLASGLAQLVSSQLPVRCDSPSQWEAEFDKFDPYEGHEFNVHGRYSYDKINLRKRRLEVVDDGLHPEYQFVEVISLFRDEKRYVIDMKTRLCHEEPLLHPDEKDNGFHAHDVPVGAILDGTRVLGSKSVVEGNLNVSFWSYHYLDRQYDWKGSFTLDKCIPVRNDYFNASSFGSAYEEFFDVTPGISDPNVFIPPASCVGQTKKIFKGRRPFLRQ